MILDMVRHGSSVAAHPGGDSARTLSERGRQEIARLAAELGTRGWRPKCAFSSPFVRARQTASLLFETMSSPPSLDLLTSLEPEVDPDETIAELGAEAHADHVVIISHLPLLGLLAKALTGVDPGFDPSSFARVELDGPLARGAGRLTLQIHAATRT